MNRRELLKFSLLSPLLGLFKSRKSGASTRLTSNCQGAKMTRELKEAWETTGTSGGHCWIEAINCEPETWHWDSAKQSVLNVDADSQHIGNRILLNTGQVYECWPRRGQL